MVNSSRAEEPKGWDDLGVELPHNDRPPPVLYDDLVPRKEADPLLLECRTRLFGQLHRNLVDNYHIPTPYTRTNPVDPVKLNV